MRDCVQVIAITTTACQFVVAMGGSVYCRTCAAPPEAAAKVMIDIFTNAKLIALLSTLKEWQLDIIQDDELSQSICEACESALIQIDDFRIQALRAREHLKSQLQSLKSNTRDIDTSSDNENDLHAKTNCVEVKMCNMEAISKSFPTVLSISEVMHLDSQLTTITGTNEKANEEEQLEKFESCLYAANEQNGELSFDSNIESSRPPEFQVVLIEEEEETKLQWMNEDDNAGEGQPINNYSSECVEHMRGSEVEFDAKESSSEFKKPNNNQKLTEKYEKICLSESISLDLQKSLRQSTALSTLSENNAKDKSNMVIQNRVKHKIVQNDAQLLSGLTESLKVEPALTSNKIKINEFETLLVAINEQLASLESGMQPNDFYTTDDLQSVLMNGLTMQMINANVNILEDDFQIEEFETWLAAVDERASTLGSISSTTRGVAELSEQLRGSQIGIDNETKLHVLENRGNFLKKPYNGEEISALNKKPTKENMEKDHIVSYNSNDESNPKHIKGITPQESDILNDISFGKAIDTVDEISSIEKDVEFKNLATNDSKPTKPLFACPRTKAPHNIRCRLCVCKVSEQPLFATKQLLHDHIASIHDDKERPYNCLQCAARYRTRSGCVAHINAIHLKKGDSCELCGKIVAGGSGQMRMHMERNHTHGNYKCEICQLELKNTSLYNFKYHKRWHNEDKLWRCELCAKAFVTRTHLMAHKVSHTRQGEFLCTRCGKSMRSKWDLRVHLFAIHGEGEAPLKCNFCEEKFTQHIQKRAHLERFHPIELAKHTLPCPKCKKLFATETHLHRHIKKQHQKDRGDTGIPEHSVCSPQQYEGFMCAHCPRKYRSKYSLIKHLGMHAIRKDRPYSCRDCNMHFKHFSELDRHDLQHHATVRPYRCGECSKAFSTKTALKIHGRVHEVKGRNFRCPDCNQRFKFEKSLNLHRVSHKTMRHSCDICNKSYIRLAQLKIHKSRYHKITDTTEEE